MDDPILDEIWRVREELVKKHGGLDGFLRYVQELDQLRRRRQQKKKNKNASRKKVKQVS